jgi:hypothetical protein
VSDKYITDWIELITYDCEPYVGKPVWSLNKNYLCLRPGENAVNICYCNFVGAGIDCALCDDTNNNSPIKMGPHYAVIFSWRVNCGPDHRASYFTELNEAKQYADKILEENGLIVIEKKLEVLL